MKKLILFVMFLASLAFSQSIRQLEYFIDTDPGIGSGIQIPVGAGSDQTINFVADLSAISAGHHTLYIRGRNLANKWSLCSFRSFYKEQLRDSLLKQLVRIEYFIDSDPGIGQGAAIEFTQGYDVTRDIILDITNTGPGQHTIYFRGMTANGQWSIISSRAFYREQVKDPLLANINNAEYFIDYDPGIGMGTGIELTPGTDLTLNFTSDLSNLAVGHHLFFIRSRQADGSWSLPSYRPFYSEKTDSTPVSTVTKLEFYFDTDPGIGNAIPLTFTPGQDLTYDFIANVTTIYSGVHKIYIRGMDSEGRWSIPGFRNFLKQGWTWTGLADTLWENPLNWEPQSIPVDTGYVYIYPRISNPFLNSWQENVRVRAVDIYTGGKFTITDSVWFSTKEDVNIIGTLLVPDNGKPVIECGRNWLTAPLTESDMGFIPGKSTVRFKGLGTFSDEFYNVQMDSGSVMSSLGAIRVQNKYIRNKGTLDLRRQDTLTILNSSPDAITGTVGYITRGTIKRAVDTTSTQPYQFESNNTFIQFHSLSRKPDVMYMTTYPDTNSYDFGIGSREILCRIDTVNNVVIADTVPAFGRWTIGEPRNKDNPVVKPRVRRVYAGGSSGKKAKGDQTSFRLSLRYEQSEVPAGAIESHFRLLEIHDTIIAVELESFSYRQEGRNVILFWKTITETNNKGFNILKREVTSTEWKQITHIAGQGTTTEMQNYSYTDQNTRNTNYYRLEQVDYDGTKRNIGEVMVESVQVPAEYFLAQNYPNPFNPNSVIRYGLPENSRVRITVTTILGEQVLVPVDENQQAGYYELQINGGKLPSGVYFYRMESGKFIQIKKMMIVK